MRGNESAVPGGHQRVTARVGRHLGLKEKIEAHQLLKVTHFMALPPAFGAGKTKRCDLKNHEARHCPAVATVTSFNFYIQLILNFDKYK